MATGQGQPTNPFLDAAPAAVPQQTSQSQQIMDLFSAPPATNNGTSGKGKSIKS